jgi:hypothetical protein
MTALLKERVGQPIRYVLPGADCESDLESCLHYLTLLTPNAACRDG